MEESQKASKELPVANVQKGSDWKILDVHGNIPGWIFVDVGSQPSSSSSSMASLNESSSSPTVETEVLGEVRT